MVHELPALRAAVQAARQAGRRVGCVPTMGALHAGHVSLVEAARRDCEFVVVSIFVNPTQFGPHEDFTKYPRELASDCRKLAGHGADLVYAPAADAMYGPGHALYVEVGGVTEPLEGECRPGHFRGVATVVLKLFNRVQPDRAYFGQKDFQQALLIRRLVADFDLPIEVIVCPIVREPDGLAMSSRNAYLDGEARQKALVLSRSLQLAADLVAAGERRPEAVLARMRALYDGLAQVEIDYLALADRETLAPVATIDARTVALVAVRVHGTRLIDNLVLEPGARIV
ncbi:MAG: pantoate--beta-alanine ligase [Pirellulales bacterium]|nr:pantoate--beta-alanine ligase [Pirellulales bacterium]